MRYDARWQRRIAREVMIEVLDGRAVAREAIERRTVRVRRHVAHRDAVAGTRVDAVEKRDVPLRSGDEDGIARVRETELDDGADAVRVAVEDVVVHARDDTTSGSYCATSASATISAMSRTAMLSASGIAFAASVIMTVQ